MDMPSPIARAHAKAWREMTGGVNAGTIHSHTDEEERVFAAYINDALVGDADIGEKLPLDLDNADTMYEVIGDGCGTSTSRRPAHALHLVFTGLSCPGCTNRRDRGRLQRAALQADQRGGQRRQAADRPPGHQQEEEAPRSA